MYAETFDQFFMWIWAKQIIRYDFLEDARMILIMF